MVKSQSEKIILVNPADKKIGVIGKMVGHRYAMLHRAFSILIFRKRDGRVETLLQQRSKKKYHGGGLWTNTCCSHPHPGEKILASAKKRLKEEMGIEVKLKKIGKFHYIAPLDRGMTENEIDHVFIGVYDSDDIFINPNEVEDYKWMEVSALKKDLIKNSSKYTPWFKQALELSLTAIRSVQSLS